MFERYTEKARRTIFFARYEASVAGSPYIETEHLLLGLLRENAALSTRVFRAQTTPDALRNEIARYSPPRPAIGTSVDIPLSNESKNVLAYAAEGAEQLDHRHIGTEHLLIGLLRAKDSLAAKLLAQYGVNEKDIRANIQDTLEAPTQRPLVMASVATSLGHFRLVLNVANLESSQAFYTKLGFRPLDIDGMNDLNSVVLTNGHCVIALYQNQFSENLLSFASPDLSSIASRLQTAGLSFEKPPSTASDGSTTVVLRDPDGNAIRLVQPGKSLL